MLGQDVRKHILVGLLGQGSLGRPEGGSPRPAAMPSTLAGRGRDVGRPPELWAGNTVRRDVGRPRGVRAGHSVWRKGGPGGLLPPLEGRQEVAGKPQSGEKPRQGTWHQGQPAEDTLLWDKKGDAPRTSSRPPGLGNPAALLAAAGKPHSAAAAMAPALVLSCPKRLRRPDTSHHPWGTMRA